MSTKVGSGHAHLLEHFRIICERMAMFVGYSRSLSVSLVPRPCRRRESGLVSTACTCANVPRKAWEIVIFAIAWIISRHNIQGLVYIHTRPRRGCNAFLLNLSFRSSTQVFPLLSSVMWGCRKIGLLICACASRRSCSCWEQQWFYRSHVGEVEMLERKLKDLRNRLTQVSRYPTCMKKCFLTCCLSMI